ncbi:unnamed protein product [Closterium sp. NIES-64]|nr:unnamed protein product [Closterium sp. NIES-64]
MTLVPLSMRGAPPSPFCPLLLLLLLSTSLALRRSGLRLLLVEGTAAARAGGARVVEGMTGAAVVAVEEVEGVGVEVGGEDRSGGVGGGDGGGGGSGSGSGGGGGGGAGWGGAVQRIVVAALGASESAAPYTAGEPAAPGAGESALSGLSLPSHRGLPLPAIPCVEGRQRIAPHSSEFPPTEAPSQNLHMDVWGPARVRGQGNERYFLLVVDDYSRYTTVFPLRCKGEVTEVLIDWIRTANGQLSASFGSDLPVLCLHSERGGEFSSDLLQAFCRAEGIRRTFTLPASPQQNGIAERRIGMVMDVAPPGWQFDHPTSRRVLSSQDVTFDESIPFYCLFPYHTSPLPAPPPPPLLFLALGPPPVDPLPPYGLAPSGVSQVDPVEPVEVLVHSGTARGTEPAGAGPGDVEPAGVGPGGAEPAGAGPGGAETEPAEHKGVEFGVAEPEGAEPGCAEPGVAEFEGAELGGAEPESVELERAQPGAVLLELEVLLLLELLEVLEPLVPEVLVLEVVELLGLVVLQEFELEALELFLLEVVLVLELVVLQEMELEALELFLLVVLLVLELVVLHDLELGVLEPSPLVLVVLHGRGRTSFHSFSRFLDRQEDFECFAGAVPHLVSMLIAPEGDPDAPDIPTPRSYAESIEGPYSSKWQSAMDAEMASLKSTGTYVDEVPPPGANIVSGMWLFRVKQPPGSPPVFKARYVARGFSQR